MDKIELIWQMGFASLNETDNELRLPSVLSDSLSQSEIDLLEARLSEHLNGAPVISFKDLDMNVYRVLRMPEMQKSGSSAAASPESTTSATSTSSASPKVKTGLRAPGKKAKIPRPPNAFILYRQKHHSQVLAKNPTLRNNDISVILGGQWKAETAETRNKFKALAEEIKRQHLLKHPGYQYAPRKPSEKKRRMTARKIAKLQEDLMGSEAFDLPTLPDSDMADMQFEMVDTDLQTHNAAMQARLDTIPSMEEILGVGHRAPNPFQSTDAMISDLNTIFPPRPAATVQPAVTQPITPPYPAAMLAPPTASAAPAQPQPPMGTQNAFLNSLINWRALRADFECMNRQMNAINGTTGTFPERTSESHPLNDEENFTYDAALQETENLFD